MNRTPELIVMLTENDATLPNAADLFEQARDARAAYWGFKDQPLCTQEMARLAARMKECGKTVVFEVVEYAEAACLAGARTGLEIGCDILMGTVFYDSVNDFCQAHGMKYMPFVGEVTARPSVLGGTAESMIRQAREYLAKGVYGFDLLGYRYVGDARSLIEAFVRATDAPVCAAGSVNSCQKLDELKAIAPWAFTIGSAFHDGSFPGSFREQINFVCEYMER